MSVKQAIALITRLSIAALGCWFFVFGCAEDPIEPPPPGDPDFLGTFSPSPVQLVLREPTVSGGGGPVRMSVASVSLDSATGWVHAYVAIQNTGSSPIVGPEGVALFDFTSGTALLGPGNPCARVDLVQPDVPADACLLDYRGAFGADGMLSPGEASALRLWVLGDSAPTAFTFHARPVDRGLAGAGEISGVVFDDRDGDGVRDADETGLEHVLVANTSPDSVHFEPTDASGRFTMQVGAPGEYRLECGFGGGRCPTTAAVLVVEILAGQTSLTGFGRADFGAKAGSNSLPAVSFLDVRTLGRPEIPPCVAAEPCTIPAGASFDVRFTGATYDCGSIAGFQWQVVWPGDISPEPWQPFGAPGRFLDAGIDTTAFSFTGDTLWTAAAGIVKVRNTVTYQRKSGNFSLRVRVRDNIGRQSLIRTRQLALNYDPNTEILRIPACDCPNPPPDCAARGMVAAGWITGIDEVVFPDSTQWILFCEGDTLPQRAHVRFYAHGVDDPRDAPVTPPATQPVDFSYRYEWRASMFESRTQPYSTPYEPRVYTLPPPLGTSWQGGSLGWGRAYDGICPFDYTFYAAAVDERGKWDGTPDSLRFYVNGSPSLGPVEAPNVLVLMPRCPAGFEAFCDPQPTFGPDTLAVQGTFVPGSSQFPVALGRTRFNLPIRALGHDHPRDRSTYYSNTHEGRIRSWYFSFDCTSGCEDLNLPGETSWRLDIQRSDPPGAQRFDEPLTVTMENDSVCLAAPLCGDFRLVLRTAGLGNYRFTLQGRDTAPVGDVCSEPSDLGPRPSTFRRDISELGRRTAVVTRDVVLRQLRDVRPGGTSPTSPFVHRAIQLEQR